jgi:hypothetical protein
MFLKQRLWLLVGLLLFAAAHVWGASMMAAALDSKDSAPVLVTLNGD